MDTIGTGPSDGGAAPAWRKRLLPLIAANVALAGLLALVEFGPVALAQPAGGDPAAARPRGQYTLVGGRVQTGNANAVWVIDSANQEMVVLQWEDGRNMIRGVGYRDLDEDTQPRSRR